MFSYFSLKIYCLMQCSAVKKQIAMLDMDTPPSCLLSLISAPFWSCLEKNKKKMGSQSQSKNFMSLPLSRMNFSLIFCCPKHHPETCQESSAQQQQTDQAPWFFKRKVNTIANNNHNSSSSNRSLKQEIQSNLLHFLTVSPQWNLFLQAHPSGKIMSSVFQQSSSSTLKLT